MENLIDKIKNGTKLFVPNINGFCFALLKESTQEEDSYYSIGERVFGDNSKELCFAVPRVRWANPYPNYKIVF